MTNLEILCKTYVEITKEWSKVSVGHEKQRLWNSTRFLEKLIKNEVRYSRYTVIPCEDNVIV